MPEVAERPSEPSLCLSQRVACAGQLAPGRSELGLLRRELGLDLPLTLAEIRDLPEQSVDGCILLPELRADLVLLGADRLERLTLGAGSGPGCKRDHEQAGEHQSRHGDAAGGRA